jgi:hypothetical protein
MQKFLAETVNNINHYEGKIYCLFPIDFIKIIFNWKYIKIIFYFKKIILKHQNHEKKTY